VIKNVSSTVPTIYTDVAAWLSMIPAILVALVLTYGFTFCHGVSGLTIDNSRNEYVLTPSMHWLKDDSGSLTIDDIATTETLARFTPHGKHAFNIGYQNAAMWFYISLEQDDIPAGKMALKRADTPWLLAIENPQLDLIDIYSRYSHGENTHQQLGDSLPYYKRPIESLNFITPITLREGESVKLFIRVKSDSLLRMPVSLRSSQSILQYQVIETSVFSMYFGIMLIMVLYNAFIYFTIKESSYLFYILYVVFITLWQATYSGHAYAYLWPSSAHWVPLSMTLTLAVACYCSLQFSRHFLNIRQYSPSIDTLLNTCSGLAIATCVTVLFVPHSIALKFNMALLSVCCLSILYAGVRSLKYGNRTARFFILARVIFLPGIIVQTAISTGVISMHIAIYRASLLATLLEGVLLSLALADRINDQRQKNQHIAQKTQQQLQISNKELSHALAEVEQSNHLKDQFLGTISHELRTPMNGVEGALELIDKNTLGSQQGHYLDIARLSANEMTSLIDSILRFSEIQSGKLQLKPESFELRSLINPLTVQYRHQCRRKGLEFECQIDKNVPMLIHGDSEHILLIVKQLIGNAIKFTEQGSVKVNTYQQGLAQKKLFITINDTGPGIAEDQRISIFDSFRQLDGKDNRQHSGLGIGLALCHQLAKQMDGSLTVEPGNDMGTTITFALPLQIGESTQIEQPGNTAEMNRRGRTILIAEDNPVNQMVLKGMLQQTGCMVLTANNGEQALHILESQPVDLIMMDCQMPVLDGFEATRIIRSNNTAYSDIPIIAVTANAMTGDSTRCLTAGMNDYIKKPVNRKVVLNKVIRWLQNDRLSGLHPHRYSG
jgi:two-component system, sensor histidine kinase LadS